MSVEVSAETEVFGLDTDGWAITFFTARIRPTPIDDDTRQRLWAAIVALRDAGWRTSIAEMFTTTDDVSVYRAGFAHDIDFVGAFEAPTLAEAHAGIERLEKAGWDAMFETSWIVGRREFLPVHSTIGRNPDSPWAYFALWEWNDAWQAATPHERAEYDIECDEAFSSDVGSGISIAGRHRFDPASSWHHLGIWEVPDLALLDHAMGMHEKVADFKFTTSRHYIGRKHSLSDILGVHR
ncbi:hypothetical protein EEB13_30270 [Rhodococcus sp. WS3]|uniref:hypothetical protein n=1 Tax=unclassified Rhodococcus (in: high G+C Gram-positive bacteria) TaxID=192944 RepID=UPI0005D3A264|nr:MULTISPECIES: hypothetical protein [unclassified Rhodococcus (in: high G+C Gram-positive bacteria)]KJF19300.1 hypothetical protein SZ00_06227 [Rhodococcus sp. AD45]ROZ42744.1 hypothetical protein EEB13_30270 [Rhodococcus sp. WS3]RZL21769.1 MAG: hypothetical protein EOP31_26075 [Rhodococcus sp. (in: high G+C Gram-positive bacteria)]